MSESSKGEISGADQLQREDTPLGERKSWCQPLVSFVNLLATVCITFRTPRAASDMTVATTSRGNILGQRLYGGTQSCLGRSSTNREEARNSREGFLRWRGHKLLTQRNERSDCESWSALSIALLEARS